MLNLWKDFFPQFQSDKVMEIFGEGFGYFTIIVTIMMLAAPRMAA